MTRDERQLAREAMRHEFRCMEACRRDAEILAQRMGATFVPIPGRLRMFLRSHALAALTPPREKSIVELDAESLL